MAAVLALKHTTLPNISQEYTHEDTEDADKDRIDMALEIDHIVETEAHIIVVGIEGAFRTTIIMVMEAIDLEMEITKAIGTMTDPFI